MRFQPRLADFQRDVGDAVGDALTTALLTHAALSEGDWVEVPLGDAKYDLRVLELRPSPAVSVIGAPLAPRPACRHIPACLAAFLCAAGCSDDDCASPSRPPVSVG